MKKIVYVISIKRVRDYDPYPEKKLLAKPVWEYASFDRYAGSMSSGLPVFDSYRPHAHEFRSVEAAKEWWINNKRYILERPEDFDLSSVAIRKETVVTTYFAEEKLCF